MLLRVWGMSAMLVGIVLLCSCAPKKSLPTTAQPPSPTRQLLSPNDRQRFQYFYLEALRQQNAEHYDAAYDLLRHCLDIDSTAAEVYYLLADYELALKQNEKALSYLEKAEALAPANDIYHERAAQYYYGLRNYDRAIDAYEKLYASDHNRIDVLSILIQLYNRQKDYQGVLSAVNRLEQAEGSSEDLTLTKMRVYELQGRKKEAYKALKSLSDQHPSDVNYRVMIGNWLLQNDQQKQAFKIFTNALHEEPDNNYALSSMFDYYNSVGEDSLAAQLRDQILLSRQTPTKTKVSLFQQVIRDNEQKHGGDSTIVLNLFERVLEISPKEVDIATMAAAYRSLKKMPEDSVNTALQRVLDIEPDNVAARLQLIQSAWNHQDWPRVIALSEPAVQLNPEEMVFYYYLGLAHFQQDQHDEALDAFRRGVGEITSESNPDIVSDFYAIMGDILHKKGLDKEAFAAYDSCLQWKDDNIGCLNNYAYYLSVRGENLQKAEQMSYRTIKAEPKNPTYLDTYAWILFMEDRYAEAQIYIDQALRADTADLDEADRVSAVVVEHAGDIHAMNDDIDGAILLWQRALDMDSDNALLPEKIRQRKYIKDDENEE